jgi:hypothetical protein
MFEATNDRFKAQKSAAGKYLMQLGMELSDLVEINGISVVRSSFWGPTNEHDVHGFYRLPPTNKGFLVIHVQAYPLMSEDWDNPNICAWLRDAPRLIHERADTTNTYTQLLNQKRYGKNPAAPANLIAQKYKSVVVN